jgi:branched-subunit amino acid ABC-type transport system permease component
LILDCANIGVVFTKLASQLTADKLVELAVIPAIFVVQMLVSYLVSVAVSKAFRFKKRPANFVTAMGVSWHLRTSRRILTVLGIRKLEFASNLTGHFALANTQGTTLGQDTRR